MAKSQLRLMSCAKTRYVTFLVSLGQIYGKNQIVKQKRNYFNLFSKNT